MGEGEESVTTFNFSFFKREKLEEVIFSRDKMSTTHKVINLPCINFTVKENHIGSARS